MTDVVWYVVAGLLFILINILPEKQFKVLMKVLNSENILGSGRKVVNWIKRLRGRR